jgi:hypothetical protein
MKMHLVGRDLWEIVTGDEEVGEHASADARKRFKKRENQAWSVVCLAVRQDLQIHVRHCTTGKEAWDALCNRYEEKSLSRILNLRRTLYRAQMDSQTTMQSHINHIKTVGDQLSDVDDTVAEKELVYILLSSLPDTYHNMITTLETLTPEKLTWEYVTDRLLHDFARRKESKKSATDSALLAGGGWKNFNKDKKNVDGKGGKGAQAHDHGNVRFLHIYCF